MIERVKSITRRFVVRLQKNSHKLIGYPRHTGRCPVCDNAVRRWLPLVRRIGVNKFKNEGEGRLCPHCFSYVRTRHFWLYIKQERLLDSMPRMLHFAPEEGLEKRLRLAIGSRLVTTDIEMPNVDVLSDITKMPFDTGSFDLIYCSNVLEHVSDDKHAMQELFRVLSPGGLAVIQVPIRGEKTYEDVEIKTPELRAVHFGQADHVRYYGRDISDRLRAVGFIVEEVVMLDKLQIDSKFVETCNLNKREILQLCRKQA